ncbi:ABC transporter G family member 11, partial [Bienertia sinuspersici]
MSRDFGYYWLRLVIYVMVTIYIGTIFFNVGTSFNSILVIVDHSCPNPLANYIFHGCYRLGALVHHLFLGLSSLCLLVDFHLLWKYEGFPKRKVKWNTMVYQLLTVVLLHGSSASGGFGHYVFFVLCLYASVTVVERLMMAITSIVPNFLIGVITGAGIQ